MAKILVTDDASFMRMVLRDLLIKSGHTVIEAENGVKMLEKYEREKPDLVTLDITMPDTDGLTAIKRLINKHPEAKVIMCTAMGQQDKVIEAVKLGARDFIVKPFSTERIEEAVTKVLAS